MGGVALRLGSPDQILFLNITWIAINFFFHLLAMLVCTAMILNLICQILAYLRIDNMKLRVMGLYFVLLSSFNQPIGIMATVFTNGQGDKGSIPGWVIPKIQKVVLDASVLNIQHYKVWTKSKWRNPRKEVAPFSIFWCNSYWKKKGVACGVMVIVVGNGHGDTSSNPGQDRLHFS